MIKKHSIYNYILNIYPTLSVITPHPPLRGKFPVPPVNLRSLVASKSGVIFCINFFRFDTGTYTRFWTSTNRLGRSWWKKGNRGTVLHGCVFDSQKIQTKKKDDSCENLVPKNKNIAHKLNKNTKNEKRSSKKNKKYWKKS